MFYVNLKKPFAGKAGNSFLAIINFIGDFLCPNLCLCCKNTLKSELLFCESCWNSIPSPDPLECPFCGVKNKTFECKCLEFKNSNLQAILSGWFFVEPLRSIIHQIKYCQSPKLGEKSGIRLGQRLIPLLPQQIDYVVPIPIHHTRKRERGYNQAELIAKGLFSTIKNGSSLALDMLKRTRSSRSQTQYNRDERQKNIVDNFMLSSEYNLKIHGKSILLIDDVITTGSTLSECAKVLRRSGALKIYAVTLGQVLKG